MHIWFACYLWKETPRLRQIWEQSEREVAVREWPCLMMVFARNWAKLPNPTMPIFRFVEAAPVDMVAARRRYVGGLKWVYMFCMYMYCLTRANNSGKNWTRQKFYPPRVSDLAYIGLLFRRLSLLWLLLRMWLQRQLKFLITQKNMAELWTAKFMDLTHVAY